MATTLKDIAERANVSRTAVSFALRGTGRLEESTRDRILNIARELGYRPNLLVQGIQTGKTQTIGVLAPTRSELYARILSGIQDELITRGYVALTLGRHREITEVQHVYHMIDRRVEGIVMVPMEGDASDDYLNAILDRDLPVVTIDTATPRTDELDFVGTDEILGGSLAAEHLLSLGHRRLAAIEYADAAIKYQQRGDTFAEKVRRTGNCECTVLRANGQEDLLDSLRNLLSGPRRPTAVFGAMDRMCPLIYRAARETGLVIPEDLSVIGYAGLEWGDYLYPALTTIRQRPTEIGRRAAQILLQRIREKERDDRGDIPFRIRINPTLLRKNSTASPPRSG